MVDVDFIKKFLTYDRSLPFIERGDTLPLELVEWISENKDSINIKNISHLLLSTGHDKTPYYITLRCPDCDEPFVHPTMLTHLIEDITNDSQTFPNWIVHDGPRLCPVCLEKFLHEQDEIRKAEQARREEERRKQLEEKERQKAESKARIDQYLEQAPEDFSPGIEDFLELEKFIIAMKHNHTGDIAARLGMIDDSNVIHSRYWAIVAAERIRCTEDPKCILTNSTDNLTILPNYKVLGDECSSPFASNPIISMGHLEKHGVPVLWRMINKRKSVPDTPSTKDNTKRAYFLDEKIEFGKYEGKTIEEILKRNKQYLEFVHQKFPSFNVIRPNGKMMF